MTQAPIPKQAFVVSTGFFLGLALLAVCTRFVIRFYMQKQRLQPIEDGLLVLSSALLVIGLSILYSKAVGPMYELTKFGSMNLSDVSLALLASPATQHLLDVALDAHKWLITSLMILWASISAVKFFFLVFFWRLVDRLRVWKIYWWCILLLNIANATFGISIFYVSCPHWDVQAFNCPTGGWSSTIVKYSASQIFLDIIADLSILVIPIGLIWRIRMDLKQKMALLGSLSITSILVVLSIVRAVGLRYNDSTYDIWEAYWLTMSANFSVLLAGGSAFRSFFVSQRQSKALGSTPRNPGSASQASKNPFSTDTAQSTATGPKEISFFSDSPTESRAGSIDTTHPGACHVTHYDSDTASQEREEREMSPIRDIEWNSVTRNSATTHLTDGICDLSAAEGLFYVQRPRPVSMISPLSPTRLPSSPTR